MYKGCSLWHSQCRWITTVFKCDTNRLQSQRLQMNLLWLPHSCDVYNHCQSCVVALWCERGFMNTKLNMDDFAKVGNYVYMNRSQIVIYSLTSSCTNWQVITSDIMTEVNVVSHGWITYLQIIHPWKSATRVIVGICASILQLPTTVLWPSQEYYLILHINGLRLVS